MGSLRRLLIVEFVAQGALAFCALLFALLFLLVGLAGQSDQLSDGLLAIVPVALIVFILAAGPVALVLAPVYAILETKKRATYTAASVAGAIAGLIGMVASHAFNSGAREDLVAKAPVCLVLCVCVALLLHVIRTWGDEHVHGA